MIGNGNNCEAMVYEAGHGLILRGKGKLVRSCVDSSGVVETMGKCSEIEAM